MLFVITILVLCKKGGPLNLLTWSKGGYLKNMGAISRGLEIIWDKKQFLFHPLLQRKLWLVPKSRHLDELTHIPAIWSCDTGQWLSCFDSCQLTILRMSNIQDVDLPRHAWDTPPSSLLVSPTPPLQSVDAYVRSVNHVTTKRKEIDHILWVWGSIPRARGTPAKIYFLNL